MVDTKSRGYSNSGRLSECGYLELFLAPVPSVVMKPIWNLYPVPELEFFQLRGNMGELAAIFFTQNQ